MKNIHKLGKTSEIIGKVIFSIVFLISIGIILTLNLSKYEENQDVSITIGAVIGSVIGFIITFYFWRLFFKPIYNLNKNIHLKLNNELSDKEFKKKWTISLICSLIFGILFIVGTFGISLLLMIPHYLLLKESKTIFNSDNTLSLNLKPINGMNEKTPIIDNNNKPKENINLSNFSKSIDFKKLNEKEVILVSVGTGIVIALIFGVFFCRTVYYNFKNFKVSKELSVYELCEFNYILAIISFILVTGGVYFFLKQKTTK